MSVSENVVVLVKEIEKCAREKSKEIYSLVWDCALCSKESEAGKAA